MFPGCFRKAFGECAQHAIRHVQENDASRERINPPEFRAQRGPHQHGQRRRHFNSSGSSAHENEGEKVGVPARVFLGLRLFERLKNTISNAHGVRQALQPGCEAFEFIVPEVTVSLAGCEDEIVVWDLHLRAIRRVGENGTLFFVHAGHLRHDHGRIPLLPQNAPNRSADLPGSKH